MKPIVIASWLACSTMSAACVAVPGAVGASVALATEGMSPLRGQAATCAGPRTKAVTLEARETTIDLGLSTRFEAWTFDGHLPGPTIEACEGDRITITLKNHATTSHGLDSHAFRASVHHFGPVTTDKTLTIDTVVDTPGVYMYHCAAGEVTDVHMKSGLAGAMIVYPRSEILRPARELVVVQSAVFGTADSDGLIPGTDPTRARKNDPEFVMFNGRLEHTAIHVAPDDLVRVYFVNVGPGVSSVHVMGTILDRVTDGRQRIEGVQTYGVPSGGGAMVEFRIPEAGSFGLVDHDRLGYVPYGLMLMFSTSGDDEHGHQVS